MQVNELRIGNYVNVPTQPNPVQVVCSIMPAHAGTSHTIEHLKNGGYLTPYELINPIPLTDEWLLKFGFDVIEELMIYANKTHCLVELPQPTGGWVFMPFCSKDSNTYITIQYVHQLQNLCFALTGEELTI